MNEKRLAKVGSGLKVSVIAILGSGSLMCVIGGYQIVTEIEKYGFYPKNCNYPNVCTNSLGSDPTFAIAIFAIIFGVALLIYGAYKATE